MSIFVRNWRDQAPYVGHISALVWTLYQSHDKDETSPPDVNRLHGINSFVKHGLQGHQHSDHHQHDSIEQLYFVLRGRGQLTIGDDKVDVRDGTAVYMPVNVPHQAFNDGDGWMEHLIVSCPLDEIREGTPAVRDWRDVHPVVLEGGTISWPLLLREGEVPASEGGVLQRVHGVTRYAVQGRQGTAWQQLDGIELVHYVISGYGTIEDLDGNHQMVTEGSAAHVLPGVAHRFANQGEGWFEYVTFAVEVGEVEMPQESDEDAESEEPVGQYGIEEATAAAVVAEVDWDEADAVETEEEIEDAETADAVEEDEDVAEAAELEDEGGVEEDGPDDAEEEDIGEEDAELASGVGDEEEDEDEAEEADGETEAEDDDGDGEVEAEEDTSEDEVDSEDGLAEDEAGDESEEDEEFDDEEDGGEDDADEADEADEYDDEEDSGEADADEIEDDDEIEEDVADDEVDEGEAGDDEAGDDEDDYLDVDESDEGEEDEADEETVEPAEEGASEDDSSGDEDDFDLEDDDADFDIDDEDEPTVEDETGEDDDDASDADRR